jgi:hypothetical protein
MSLVLFAKLVNSLEVCLDEFGSFYSNTSACEVEMPIPFVPFYFRGPPREEERRQFLEELLGYSMLHVKGSVGLPSSQYKQAHACSDAEIVKLYPAHVIKGINGRFVRLFPILPWNTPLPVTLNDRRCVIKNAFPKIEDRPEKAKFMTFLEDAGQLRVLNALYPPTPQRDWLRRTESGLLFILPLYDEHRSRLCIGPLKEFVGKSNQELVATYVSLSSPSKYLESPPPSSRRRSP